MAIITSPPAIIFINTDLTNQVLSTFVRQLFITQVLSASMFDGYVAADGYYALHARQDGYRILVLRDLFDQTNRNQADIVLFAKAGLVSVLSNRYGPPGITLPIDQCYLTALINLQMVPPSFERPDLDDGFVGETDNDDFDPFHLDPNTNPEPVDIP